MRPVVNIGGVIPASLNCFRNILCSFAPDAEEDEVGTFCFQVGDHSADLPSIEPVVHHRQKRVRYKSR